MAANNKIGRFTERIELLVRRRWGRLTLEMLTDEANANLDSLMGGKPVDVRKRTGLEHWSDDAILRRLIDLGTLSPADFKRRPGLKM